MAGYFESNGYKKRINELLDVTLGGVRATKTSTRRIRDCCPPPAPAPLHARAPCLTQSANQPAAPAIETYR